MRTTIGVWRSGHLNTPPPDELHKRIGGLPAIEAEAASSSDDQASNEAKQIASGKTAEVLARQAAEKEHSRSQKFKDHFEVIAIAIMWLFAAGIIAVGVTWLYHLLSPLSWHWLEPTDLSRVQNIFTGGVLTAVVADHFRKRMTKD